jgi:hypothetical protein
MRRCCIKRKRNGPETDDEEQSQEEGGPPAPVHARVASLHFGHKPPPEERLRPSGGNHFAAFGGGRFGARRQKDAIHFGISLASNFSPGTDLRGFVAMEKFDGVGDRALDVSEVHQIAGRAGRFGMHEEGFAGVLQEAEPDAARMLKERLGAEPRAPRDFKAPVAPNGRHVETIAERLGQRRLHAVLQLGILLGSTKGSSMR